MRYLLKSLPPYLFDYVTLMDRLKPYRSPHAKITRMLKQQEIIRVKKGLYILDPEWGGEMDKLVLSNLIYGPSYVSLDAALSYWGLIPERVEEVTCVTNKRNKRFVTPVGRFSYHYLNNHRFSMGRKLEGTGPARFLIASPEKALCDKIASLPHLNKAYEVSQLLEFDLRVDLEELAGMDAQMLQAIQIHYKKAAVTRFVRWYLQTYGNTRP